MVEIAIVGMGAVGVAVTQAVLSAGLAQKVTLYDKNFSKAEGEAWDFAHAACLLPTCKVQCKPLEELRGADLCIVTAGVKSRPGESRLALLERNLLVAEEVSALLKTNGLPKTLMVLTNPVDIITEYFTRSFNNLNVCVLGSGTSLDTFRLRQIIAEQANVNASNVHALVVGEHGDSSVSLFSSARIGCAPLVAFPHPDKPAFAETQFAEITTQVRRAAAKIIERKGATAHAIGLTAGRLAKALLKNENVILPLSVRIENNLCISVPCVLNSSGELNQIHFSMTSAEAAQFEQSAHVLREIVKNCF